MIIFKNSYIDTLAETLVYKLNSKDKIIYQIVAR